MNIKKMQTIDNIEEVSLAAGLYLVSTPIGNLRDITLRALDVLQAADIVACEDTRMTGKLMQAYGLKKKLVPYNDHNAGRQRGGLLGALGNDQVVALVSDAGTPLVSDPGYKLVQDCLDLGVMVTSVPGANAPLAALQLSGLPSDKFVFLGFSPNKSQARRTFLLDWAQTDASLILFESAGRLHDSLLDMLSVLGDRQAAVVREITKRFEEVQRGSLSHLADFYEDNRPKGEIVVVVEAAKENITDDQTIKQQLSTALESMSLKDAAAFVAESSGLPKKKIYAMALDLKE